MINFGGNPASLLGIALAICGVALYFLRTFRPELSRDSDIFFSAVALICGGILLFQGWRLDPLLFLGQLALAGSAVFFAVENIRLRGITTEQAKRVTPVVDDERPVSRVYRAELDELPYADDPYGYEQERAPVRRIRGSRDTRPDSSYERDRPSSADRDRYPGSGAERDRYAADSSSRRPSSRYSSSSPGGERRLTSSTSGSGSSGDRPPRRRPSSSSSGRSTPSEGYSTWDDESPASARSASTPKPRSERSYRPDVDLETAEAPPASSSRRRTRPPSVSSSSSSTSASRRRTPSSPRTEAGDYADYQPIDYATDDVSGTSTDFT